MKVNTLANVFNFVIPFFLYFIDFFVDLSNLQK